MALRLVEPTRDEGHLAQLLELQLERQAWSGGVIAVRWAALRLGRIEEVQGCWFEDDSRVDQSRTLNALVDRLSSRLEAKAVLRVEVLPDAQPEYVARLVPWTNVEPTQDRAVPLAAGTIAGPPPAAPRQSRSPSM